MMKNESDTEGEIVNLQGRAIQEKQILSVKPLLSAEPGMLLCNNSYVIEAEQNRWRRIADKAGSFLPFFPKRWKPETL